MLYSPTVYNRARWWNRATRSMSVPIYEYYCPDCDVEFEKLVKLAEANAVQDCPECGGRHTQKKLSVFATSGGSTGAGAASSSCGSGGRFS
jgi:putative FmdB family regulatory protein